MQVSTPAQSKIEFTAHLIKIFSQIWNICCKGKLYNVKNGRINNFKNISLLVIIYISYTQKWAAQCNAPLRFGRHRMMGGFIYCIDFIRRLCLNVKIYYCKCFIVVWDYVACSVALHCDAWDRNTKAILRFCVIWGFMGFIFYVHTVVGRDTYSIYTKMGARIHRTVALQCVHKHIQL